MVKNLFADGGDEEIDFLPEDPEGNGNHLFFVRLIPMTFRPRKSVKEKRQTTGLIEDE